MGSLLWYGVEIMQETFLNIRRYGTFVLLFTTILVFIVLGLFQREIFLQIADIISKFIWPAIIALLSLFGFVVGGVIKNPPKSFSHFLDNGLVQIAVLELFSFMLGLTMYIYLTQRPGQIELRLASGTTLPQLKVSMMSEGDSEKGKEILVPQTLSNVKPGVYTFKIIENNYYPFETEVDLKPAEIATVTLKDKKISATLIVNSKPEGAQIWIDGSLQENTTPDTLYDLDPGVLKLTLKLAGYQSETRSVSLDSLTVTNLGIITLRKLYQIRFFCRYEDITFTIDNQEYTGSKEGVWLPEGKHIINYRRAGQTGRKIKEIYIKENKTITIP